MRSPGSDLELNSESEGAHILVAPLVDQSSSQSSTTGDSVSTGVPRIVYGSRSSTLRE